MLREVESTNAYLNAVQRSQRSPEGTAVLAGFQTGGRGLQGNQWLSERDANLLVSFLFYPTFLNTRTVFQLTMAVSVSLVEAVAEAYALDLKVKWPNDIYYGNRKVGGILIENTIYDFEVRQSIVGIGLNVNQTEFPTELPNPVSLRQILGRELSTEALYVSICRNLEKNYLQLKSSGDKQIREAYHRCLLRRGDWAWYEVSGKRMEGMILGVNQEGRLMMQEQSGHSQHFDPKTIRYLFGPEDGNGF